MRVDSRPRELALVGVTLVLVYVAGVGAVLFRPDGSSVATWWPAAGAAVALLVLCPVRHRPALAVGVVIATGLANLTAGRDADLSLLLGLSNAAEAWVVAVLLRGRRPEQPPLESPDDFLRLLGACTAGALVVGVHDRPLGMGDRW